MIIKITYLNKVCVKKSRKHTGIKNYWHESNYTREDLELDPKILCKSDPVSAPKQCCGAASF
jgi:hypothetical protein